MKKQDYDVILKDIYEANRLKSFRFNINSCELSELDYHFRKEFFKNYDYKNLFNELIYYSNDNVIVDYEDSLHSHYITYKSGFEDNEYIFVGPFRYEALSDDEIIFIADKNNLPSSSIDTIKKYLMRTPIINDVAAWSTLLTRLLSKRIGHELNFVWHSKEKAKGYAQGEKILSFTPNSVAAFSVLEARYETEANLLKAVQAGNINEALYYHNQFMAFHLETSNTDNLRNTKNIIIAVNTLFRKAVQLAYVHPLYIDDLNRKIRLEIENTNSVNQLDLLLPAMIRKYCLLVKLYSRAQYSKLIRDVLSDIDFHYQERLSLAIFANKYSVTRNYLSTLFHKEVKMTLTDYINSTRVRRSLPLIIETTLSMQDISEQCGFSDANYFTRNFKKYQGMSPMQYRKSLLE